MLYKDSEGVKLAQENVIYVRGGVEYVQPVTEGHQWWLDFEQKWNDMQIIRFEAIVYTQEQLDRFEEIKNLDIATNILNDYVMEGIIGEGLEILQLKKENQELRSLLADLTETVLLGGA